MKTVVYNLAKETVGEIDLPDAIFARPWNPDLVAQALRAQEASSRKPLAHTKGRGEVRGGGKKPWRQKGTGRARHGSIRSPIWKGGGVTHGPRNEKVFARAIPKKMLRAAIHSALSKKLADRELAIIERFSISRPKTKEMHRALHAFSQSTLLVPERGNHAVYRASRNLPNVKATDAATLNVRDILRFKHLLLAKEAVSAIR